MIIWETINPSTTMIGNKNLHAEYLSRINRTFDYIEANIEKPMTLEELATVANLSKYYFNRIAKGIKAMRSQFNIFVLI